MDINELITIVKNKLLNQINIESINIEDKSFLHKNHKGNQEGKYHLKLIIVSQELKKMNKIESNKKIYKILSFMIKDKKNNSEKINLVLLKKIGKPIFNKQYSKKKLNLFLKKFLTN